MEFSYWRKKFFSILGGDLINFFKVGGRADSWFKVHDNYLQGSYALGPWKDQASGSGIIFLQLVRQ